MEMHQPLPHDDATVTSQGGTGCQMWHGCRVQLALMQKSVPHSHMLKKLKMQPAC